MRTKPINRKVSDYQETSDEYSTCVYAVSYTHLYDGFEVYYQPIVDCQSEQIIGAEALMRFSMITEEGREFVSPMEMCIRDRHLPASYFIEIIKTERIKEI